jgi:DNA repair protein RecO (recombination protein O)
LWRLESFQTLRDLSLLGRDLTRLAYVAYACELTDALIHEPEPDPRLFAALAEAIERTLDPEPLTAAVLRRYELHLLERIGLLPSLQRCCVCGTPVSLSEGAQVPFDASRGGVLCPPHGVTAPAVVAEVLILVQALRCASDASAADDVLERAETEIRRAARDLTAGLLRSQLRRPLRSLQFFAQVGHAPRGAGSGPAEGDFPAD